MRLDWRGRVTLIHASSERSIAIAVVVIVGQPLANFFIATLLLEER